MVYMYSYIIIQYVHFQRVTLYRNIGILIEILTEETETLPDNDVGKRSTNAQVSIKSPAC